MEALRVQALLYGFVSLKCGVHFSVVLARRALSFGVDLKALILESSHTRHLPRFGLEFVVSAHSEKQQHQLRKEALPGHIWEFPNIRGPSVNPKQ